jgi:hypothetical protein
MKYMFLIYGNEAAEARIPEPQMNAIMQEYFAFSKESREHETFIDGDAIRPTSEAVTVRVRGGKTLTTDGPFAETHEQLGGFFILDCKDLDEALRYAARIPGARMGSIEVRPIMVYDQG